MSQQYNSRAQFALWSALPWSFYLTEEHRFCKDHMEVGSEVTQLLLLWIRCFLLDIDLNRSLVKIFLISVEIVINLFDDQPQYSIPDLFEVWRVELGLCKQVLTTGHLAWVSKSMVSTNYQRKVYFDTSEPMVSTKHASSNCPWMFTWKAEDKPCSCLVDSMPWLYIQDPWWL